MLEQQRACQDFPVCSHPIFQVLSAPSRPYVSALQQNIAEKHCRHCSHCSAIWDPDCFPSFAFRNLNPGPGPFSFTLLFHRSTDRVFARNSLLFLRFRSKYREPTLGSFRLHLLPTEYIPSLDWYPEKSFEYFEYFAPGASSHITFHPPPFVAQLFRQSRCLPPTTREQRRARHLFSFLLSAGFPLYPRLGLGCTTHCRASQTPRYVKSISPRCHPAAKCNSMLTNPHSPT